MSVEKTGFLNPFRLMKDLEPGLCEVCGVKHEPESPHNAQSLFYQYNFYDKNGRWPTWKDAMEHCEPMMKGLWIEALMEKGVKIE